MIESKHEFESKDLAFLNSFILFTEKKLKREMEMDEILALKLVDFILQGPFNIKMALERSIFRLKYLYFVFTKRFESKNTRNLPNSFPKFDIDSKRRYQIKNMC